jgi:anti-sigma factor ChrR (cupin superfamily)
MTNDRPHNENRHVDREETGHEDTALSEMIGWLEEHEHNVGGVLLRTLAGNDGMDNQDSLKERLLSSVQGATPMLSYVGEVAAMLDLSRAQARSYLKELENEESWERSEIPGVYYRPVERPSAMGQDEKAAFVKILPGHGFPHHEHLDEEAILILQGRCLDTGNSEMLSEGSLQFAGSEYEHSAVVPEDEPVPVIYLAVIRGGIKVGDEVMYS